MIKIKSKGITNFECHFIGPIPKEKQIQSQTNLVYHGAIHDEVRIKEILQSSDVLLCPSWSEGMPTVILEAMARGCAIIATDVGAVSEQVDIKNGFLIAPGSLGELKNAMGQMITLPINELNILKKASIQRVNDKFMWKNLVEKTIMEISKTMRIKNQG